MLAPGVGRVWSWVGTGDDTVSRTRMAATRARLAASRQTSASLCRVTRTCTSCDVAVPPPLCQLLDLDVGCAENAGAGCGRRPTMGGWRARCGVPSAVSVWQRRGSPRWRACVVPDAKRSRYVDDDLDASFPKALSPPLTLRRSRAATRKDWHVDCGGFIGGGA